MTTRRYNLYIGYDIRGTPVAFGYRSDMGGYRFL